MSHARNAKWALAILALGATSPLSAGCNPPERPYLPQSSAAMRAYADLLRADFETYLADVQAYFRCLDAERDRTFREAAQVTAQYGAFLDALRKAPP
jgi:hypothetical protein